MHQQLRNDLRGGVSSLHWHFAKTGGAAMLTAGLGLLVETNSKMVYFIHSGGLCVGKILF
jgi:hypothetical protein